MFVFYILARSHSGLLVVKVIAASQEEWFVLCEVFSGSSRPQAADLPVQFTASSHEWEQLPTLNNRAVLYSAVT